MDEAIARLCRIARARPRFFSNTGGLQGDSFPPPHRPGGRSDLGGGEIGVGDGKGGICGGGKVTGGYSREGVYAVYTVHHVKRNNFSANDQQQVLVFFSSAFADII